MYLPHHTFGSTGLDVSAICVGSSGWGRLLVDETPEQRDVRIGAMLGHLSRDQSACNFIDSSNIYSDGLSEQLIGEAFRDHGVPSGIVIQTKLDRHNVTGEFTSDRMWASLEESLTRLGVDRIQVLYLHDPEHIGFAASMEPGGPVDALLDMKKQGLASHIGISGGPVSLLDRFVGTGLFDAIVTHNRYTLVDRSADALIEHAAQRGMGITNAAPFGGGVLTGASRFSNTYGYAPAKPAVQTAIAEISRLCDRARVPVAAAALQLSVRDSRIHSTIVGAGSTRQLESNLSLLDVAIPEALWSEIDAVVPGPEHALDSISSGG